ncbi:hypothetical protein FA95DRAFT_1565152 [Auriscalpium vulgare]|uniref:Uncharacterized protein n=1 Tax=Auriscalpium vulgare TaxID=40419 RepID=A0ACB8RC31_9AGAM|nr:hypothetical protein FA95DRAFT_1565152 [Auriscalpium vulgare]
MKPPEAARRHAEKAAATSSLARRPGACSRCKRLKMKCVFTNDGNSCSRCSVGGHECLVEGRKPRTPGQREFLLRQIREKNEAISDLLSQLHHTSAMSTPLSISASRMLLSSAEREANGEVLSWMDKRHTATARSSEKACLSYDTSLLEDEDMLSDEEDDEDSADELQLMPSDASQMAHLDDPRLIALPDEGAPLGFIANCALKLNQATVAPNPSFAGLQFGVANHHYFQPSPYADLNLRRIIVEREMLPDILVSGLISPDEGRVLFDVFFEHINPFLSLLDEAIHNAASVLRRCPFLFTVVCAVSSRYYSQRPGLYKLAIHFAKASAASASVDGWKCVEMCQAYLILAAYGVPHRRFEESRSWFYTGVATRLAVELNLNSISALRPSDERHERELLNRYRTWMICCIMDGSMSLEMGKPPICRDEDEILRNSTRWCSESKFRHPLDAELPTLIELIRIIHRFNDSVGSLGPRALQTRNLPSIIEAFQHELRRAVDHYSTAMSGKLRVGMVAYFQQYCRLIIFSFGLRSETTADAPITKPSMYLASCIDAAFSLLRIWKDHLLLTGHMKYAPDFFFVGTGFAGAFLLKLLHPRFVAVLGDEERLQILTLEETLIRILASDTIAADDQHTPRLYAAFLDSFLKNVMSMWITQPQSVQTQS